jgi:hypothetical protein
MEEEVIVREEEEEMMLAVCPEEGMREREEKDKDPVEEEGKITEEEVERVILVLD